MPIKGSENMERAIHVRDVINAYMSQGDLGLVELEEDLQWIPTIWDVLKNKDAAGNYLDYDKTSFAQYVETIKALKSFIELMNSPPPLNSTAGLDTNLGLIVSTFSPVKEFHGIISSSSPYYRVWNQSIRQMMLRYIKDQYDKYMLISGGISIDLKRKNFARQLHLAFKKQDSLPKDINDDLIDFVDLGVEGLGSMAVGSIKKLS